MDDTTDVDDRVLQLGTELLERGGHPRRRFVGEDVESQSDAGELWAQPVVQVVAQPSAFLLARRDDALAGATEVLGEADVGDRRRRLPGEVGDELALPVRHGRL